MLFNQLLWDFQLVLETERERELEASDRPGDALPSAYRLLHQPALAPPAGGSAGWGAPRPGQVGPARTAVGATEAPLIGQSDSVIAHAACLLRFPNENSTNDSHL